MTLNMPIGGISQPTYTKAGDRFTPGGESGGAGFEEALAAKSKRKASDTDPAEANARSSWSPQSYASRLGYGGAGIGKDGNASGESVEESLAWAEGEVPDIGADVTITVEDTAPAPAETALPDTPSPETAPMPQPDAAAGGENGEAARAALLAMDEAILAARQQQAASQTQSAADTKGAPAAANAAAAAQAAQASPVAERQGDQRGRTPPPSTPQGLAGTAAKGDPNSMASTNVQADAAERLAAKAVDRDVARFIPAREQLAQGNSQPKSLPQANATDMFNGQVKVVGYNAALAPSATAMPLLGNTTASVVAAIEGDHTWRAAAAESGALAGQRAQSLSTGVNTLRIQLQPVELGMVTARLSASGTQLSVEIQVESNDARQKLANDSDAILKALRGLGFDIDKVTIQQAPQTSQPSSAMAQQGGSGREQFTPNQQAQGESGDRGQSGDRSTHARDGERAAPGPGETAADRAGSSIYI